MPATLFKATEEPQRALLPDLLVPRWVDELETGRMHSRLAAKAELASLAGEADMPACLRRKTAQGRAQFRRPEDQGPDGGQ